MNRSLAVLISVCICACSQMPSEDVLKARNQFVATQFDVDTGEPQQRVLSVKAAQSWVSVEAWQTVLLRNELERLSERYKTQGVATPTLLSVWPQLPGTNYEPQEHWFIVLDGQPYWQWRFGCLDDCPADTETIWLPIKTVHTLFPDTFSFETPTPSPSEPLRSTDPKVWEQFDGDTLESINNDELDWILPQNPADAVLLQEKSRVE